MPKAKAPTAPSVAAPAENAANSTVSKAPTSLGGNNEVMNVEFNDLLEVMPGAEILKTNANTDHDEDEQNEGSPADDVVAENDESENAEASETEPAAADESTENPEGESQEEADPEAKAEGEVESEEETEGQNLSAGVQKRIDKLTAQKKDALTRAENAETKLKEVEAKNAELSQKLQTAETSSVRIAPTADDPLSDTWSPDDVNQRINTARTMKAWAMRHPNGGTITLADGKTVELDEDAVKEHLIRSDEIISIHAPKRIEYLTQVTQFNQIAKTEYPELFDSSTSEYQQAAAALKQIPWLQKLPNYALILGDALRGQKMRMEKAKAATEAKNKPKPSPAPAPKAPVRQTAPKVSGRQVVVNGAIKNVMERGGDRKSLEAAVEAFI